MSRAIRYSTSGSRDPPATTAGSASVGSLDRPVRTLVGQHLGLPPLIGRILDPPGSDPVAPLVTKAHRLVGRFNTPRGVFGTIGGAASLEDSPARWSSVVYSPFGHEVGGVHGTSIDRRQNDWVIEPCSSAPSRSWPSRQRPLPPHTAWSAIRNVPLPASGLQPLLHCLPLFPIATSRRVPR